MGGSKHIKIFRWFCLLITLKTQCLTIFHKINCKIAKLLDFMNILLWLYSTLAGKFPTECYIFFSRKNLLQCNVEHIMKNTYFQWHSSNCSFWPLLSFESLIQNWSQNRKTFKFRKYFAQVVFSDKFHTKWYISFLGKRRWNFDCFYWHPIFELFTQNLSQNREILIFRDYF